MVDFETPHHHPDLDPYRPRYVQLRNHRIKRGVAFRLAPSLCYMMFTIYYMIEYPLTLNH